MSDQAFASYARSAAFSMSLSAKMVDRLLMLWKPSEVATRYDWWTPPTPTYEVGTSYQWAGTDQALARRGLLIGQTASFGELQDIVPTEPGELTARLLVAAGFTVPRHCLPFGYFVECHPDDEDHLGGRHSARLVWPDRVGSEPEFEPIDLPPDRRLDLWQPGDEHFYGHMAMEDKRVIDERVLDAITHPTQEVRT